VLYTLFCSYWECNLKRLAITYAKVEEEENIESSMPRKALGLCTWSNLVWGEYYFLFA